MNTYTVDDIKTSELQEVIKNLPEGSLKDYYTTFFFNHEQILAKYKNEYKELKTSETIRITVETICKILFWEYLQEEAGTYENEEGAIPNHCWVRRLTGGEVHRNEIEMLDESVNDAFQRRKECGYYYVDMPIILQRACAILWKLGQKADAKNRLYNKIKEGYDNLYGPGNTDSNHGTPINGQSKFTPQTLYSNYFSWVRSLRDICKGQIGNKWDGLQFPEDTPLTFDEKKIYNNEQRMIEDNDFKKFYDIINNFTREYGRKYILVAPKEFPKELQRAVAKVYWNMIISFDPNGEENGHLEKTLEEAWEGNRSIWMDDVITSGNNYSYWVWANGNGHFAVEIAEYKEWRRTYRDDIISKIRNLAKHSSGSPITILELYCNDTKFASSLYEKINNIPNDIQILALGENGEETKADEDEIDKDYEFLNISKEKLIHFFDNINGNLAETQGAKCKDESITDADVADLQELGIEVVPYIDKAATMKKNDAGRNYYSTGAKIDWDDLYNDVDVKRDGYDDYFVGIKRDIEKGLQFDRYICHDPCSGGTTFARRFAYDLMQMHYDKKFDNGDCFVVMLNEMRVDANMMGKRMSEFVEDKLSPTNCMLIIVVERTISDENYNILTKKCKDHNISTIRLLVRDKASDNISKAKKVVLGCQILPDEKNDFIKKYSEYEHKPQNAFMELKEVIDFPLAFENSKKFKFKDYVEHWLEKLVAEEQDAIKQAFAYLALASKYTCDEDRYVNPNFTLPIIKGSSDFRVGFVM